MSDLIRREDAIKAVAEVLSLNRFASFKDIKDFGRFAERMLRNVPSADRPQGEWKDIGWKGDWQFETDGRGNCWYEYECSECGFHSKGSKSNFCPNCGCRMKGADDE